MEEHRILESTTNVNREQLNFNFQRQFGKAPTHQYFSPGRVNLIGEHTDYNGGRVMPAAIDIGTYFAIRTTTSGNINIYSEAFSDQRTIALDELGTLKAEGNWYEIGRAHV